MKLYETAMTPSSRRVSIFLKELGIEIEKIQLDVIAGDNLCEPFSKKSINKKVPLLELDDGTCLSESVAICRYLDAITENDKALFGGNPLEQAQVEMWHRIIEFQGLYTGFQAFRNLTAIYQDRETCIKAWGVESKQRVIDFLPTLESRLAQSPYIAGDKFTIVDITGFIFIDFATGGLEIDVFAEYPHIKAWYAKVSARPAMH